MLPVLGFDARIRNEKVICLYVHMCASKGSSDDEQLRSPGGLAKDIRDTGQWTLVQSKDLTYLSGYFFFFLAVVQFFHSSAK